MAIKINFTGVETNRTFEAWPVGEEIEFTIFAITEGTSKANNPKLTFELNHVGSKRKKWEDFSLVPTALFKLKKLLVALGYEKENLEGDFDFDPSDILGRTLVLKFGPERPIPNSDLMVQDVVSIAAA